MPKTVTTSEANNTLGSLVGWVVENEDEVIVESQGEPRAVIMSFDAYEELRVLKEQQRRQAALEQLRQIRDRVQARHPNIESEEEAMALAERLVSDVIDDMAAEGKIVFERKT